MHTENWVFCKICIVKPDDDGRFTHSQLNSDHGWFILNCMTASTALHKSRDFHDIWDYHFNRPPPPPPPAPTHHSPPLPPAPPHHSHPVMRL